MTDSVFKIVGPPGCGKTTYIARQTAIAVEKYGAGNVMVTSLTRAAAKEAAGRIIPDNQHPDEESVNVGTLHKILFHAFGKPTIVAAKHITEWNEEYPSMRISPNAVAADDVGRSVFVKERGDKFLADTDLLRSKMIPVDEWTSSQKRFNDYWTDFKENIDAVDFTDLIERGIRELPFAPGQPSVIFIDEAQDLSTAELRLVRNWSGQANKTIIVGDGDQALYGWRGSDPKILADPIWKILDQSYRVPANPHAFAMKVIQRCQARPDVRYDPTDKEGIFETWDLTIKSPEIIRKIERSTEDGYRVMVLASCDYMLSGLIKELRAAGIPYGNRFSTRWNPLYPGRGLSSADRIRALTVWNDRLEPSSFRIPTPEEVRSFAPLLRSGPVKRGMKTVLMKLNDKNEPHDVKLTLELALEEQAMEALRSGTFDCIEEILTPAARSNMEYPLNIIRNYGLRELFNEPMIDIGTIHSVKGGEAEHVILAPDLSNAGWQTYQERGWNGIDSVRRLYYVGATRTRHRLTMLSPFGPRRFEP